MPGDIYQLELRVEDTGSGINQSDIAKIFSAFEQSKFGHDHSGTGLGLAISRYHARLMGGDIIVQSEENVGSVFIFRFPIEVCRQPILETKPPRGEVTGLKDSLRQYRILIADDNFENRELLSHFLQPAGFSLKQVVDGEACIDEFKSWRPDLVLLDLSMPKMNGEQALAVIKGLSAIIKSKVVIVTANVFEDQRRSIIKQGADGFLRKPFKKWEILDEVARQLNIEYEFSDAIARSGSARTQLEDRGKASSQNGNSLGETLQDLKQATIILDMDRMRSLIGEIKECDLAFADRLDLLIENFEFERVEELVKSYTPHLLTEEI